MTSVMCEMYDCKRNEHGVCSCETIGIEYTLYDSEELGICQDFEKKDLIYENHQYDHIKPKW
jgi:hypothetical protein